MNKFKNHLKDLEVQYSPEHWNENCQATIPAAWEVINSDGFVVALAETEMEALSLAGR